uniref:Potassium transporter n=1 Tax=Zooxanthella nutricula TaxID=1333877 RepID=A0A7S2PGD0_9DINO
MIFWALTFVVGFKYVCIVMSVSHHGEGGTFAMTSKILESSEQDGKPVGKTMRAAVTFLGMLGLALLAGDGCITPPVSVLGALNGIPLAISADAQVAIAVVVLLFVFLVQRRGSDFIGRIAGPVMIVWFAAIAALGIYNLFQHPGAAKLVAHGLNPSCLVSFWTQGRYRGADAWRSLAGVVLSVTGAEALYADLGHFGRGPISAAWFGLVYPCLVVQYMGQAASLCVNGRGVNNPFFQAVPREMLWPMTILAVFAAVIASQAMISGLFSLLAQAQAFKLVPRILVLHTNPDQQGQVYIPEANWALCIACLAMTIGFKSSDSLAGAYGITVTSTFLISSILLWTVMRRVWGWRMLPALLLTVPIAVVDAALWSANVLKIVDSGWVPVVISVCLCFLMHTYQWGRGREESVMARQLEAETSELQRQGAPVALATVATLPGLQAALDHSLLARTGKAAVFLTPYEWRVPRTLGALASLLGSLPQTIVLLSVSFEAVPFISDEHRAAFTALSSGVYSVVLYFGYAEPLVAGTRAVHKALARLAREHCDEHPGLRSLTTLDGENEASPMASREAGASAAELGAGGRGAAASGTTDLQGSTFVVSKVHYACFPDAKHGWWNRVRVAVYRFLVTNARSSIRFLGLEGEETVEISVVRFV